MKLYPIDMISPGSKKGKYRRHCLSIGSRSTTCMALLTPQAFSKPQPCPKVQTWWLAVYQDKVIWRRGNGSMTFSAAEWEQKE
jgi:hypothetical protein